MCPILRMPSTPNRQKTLSIQKAAANVRRLEKKRFDALLERIALEAMYNKLPKHLKSPKKR